MASERRRPQGDESDTKPGRGPIFLVLLAVLLLAVAVALLVTTPSLDFHARGR